MTTELRLSKYSIISSLLTYTRNSPNPDYRAWKTNRVTFNWLATVTLHMPIINPRSDEKYLQLSNYLIHSIISSITKPWWKKNPATFNQLATVSLNMPIIKPQLSDVDPMTTCYPMYRIISSVLTLNRNLIRAWKMNLGNAPFLQSVGAGVLFKLVLDERPRIRFPGTPRHGGLERSIEWTQQGAMKNQNMRNLRFEIFEGSRECAYRPTSCKVEIPEP